MVSNSLPLEVLKDSSRQLSEEVQVSFKDVTCSVRASYTFFSRERKEILHGVSGHFRGGELTAIMGPSGSGKSTLLNILAGYKKKGYMGEVCVEGGADRKCYIMQEESLHPLLTVREAMNIAASLKLGSSVNIKQRIHRVNEILDSLGLSAHAMTLSGHLSGGQKKRLGIALELIDNPKVMFFDEPTSGLDSSTTKQCVKLLKDLSREGRAVICTLHQPSATIFKVIDQVYCLASGWCTYNGAPSGLNTFLGEHGLCCPQYHNPADFLLEICCGEYGDHIPAMSEACKNGKSEDWVKRIDSSSENINSSQMNNAQVTTPVHAPDLPPLECFHKQTYPVSFVKQVVVLVQRIGIQLIRDHFLMHSRLMIHAAIGLLIGIFFFDIGCDAGMVFSNYNVLFFSVLFLAFSALQSMAIAFPLEMPIIRKEHFNCWYSIKAYYLANTIADLPIQVSCAIIYCTIVYWMSGQPPEWVRFFMFTFMGIITSLLAQSIGYLVGASMKVMNGVMLGPLSITPWVLFSGFFLQARDSPDWARWLYTISWLRRCIEGLVASVHGYKRQRLPCISEDYCHFVSPMKFLKELDMADQSFGFNVAFILIFYVFLKVCTYYILIYQLRLKR